jgi:MATE family multidrug resistance protein
VDVARLTVPLLVIGAIFQLFDGIQAIGVGVLRGMSDVTIPTVSTFVAYWVIGLPLAALLMFQYDMGLEGIWYGLTAGLAFSAVAMSLRFHWKTK